MAAVLAEGPFCLVRGPCPEGEKKEYKDQKFYVTEGQKRYKQKSEQGTKCPGGLWQVAYKAERRDMSGQVPDSISSIIPV